MKKYIIIIALSLCNSTWAIKKTTKNVPAYIQTDHLKTLCNNSGWRTTVDNIPFTQLSEKPEWEPTINSIITAHEEKRINKKKFYLYSHWRYLITLKHTDNAPVTKNKLFVISKL